MRKQIIYGGLVVLLVFTAFIFQIAQNYITTVCLLWFALLFSSFYINIPTKEIKKGYTNKKNVERLCKLALRDGFTIGQESILFPLDYTSEDKDKIVEEWIKDNLNTE